MNQKEPTKTCMMISNWIKPFWYPWFIYNKFSALRVIHKDLLWVLMRNYSPKYVKFAWGLLRCSLLSPPPVDKADWILFFNNLRTSLTRPITHWYMVRFYITHSSPHHRFLNWNCLDRLVQLPSIWWITHLLWYLISRWYHLTISWCNHTRAVMPTRWYQLTISWCNHTRVVMPTRWYLLTISWWTTHVLWYLTSRWYQLKISWCNHTRSVIPTRWYQLTISWWIAHVPWYIISRWYQLKISWCNHTRIAMPTRWYQLTISWWITHVLWYLPGGTN